MRQTSHLITTSTAARLLEPSEGTVRNVERRGVLTAVRIASGIRLLTRESVDTLARTLRRQDDGNGAA